MDTNTQPTQPTRTQERLYLTAVDLFAEQGYQNTSLRDLAARLGIGAGSLYNHIESKQALLFDLIEECMSDLLSLTRVKLKAAQGTRARLHAFVSAFIELQQSEQKKVQLMLREARNLTAEHARLHAAMRDEYTQQLMAIIASTFPRGIDRSRTKFFTDRVIGMLESLCQSSDIDSALSQWQIIEQLTEMILGAASRLELEPSTAQTARASSSAV
ncbi:TetR/AcrR family transcriptional regulator [Pseudomonas guariconensis]|uniref:TetR/AcrR family transcriptional regulator n=1 Tax=Pseudomonas guariconensis TaxID=1288410 RepID=UPI0023649422|nr:TetR/AcrR family transcriptional regulator [Pseudomonas guariconensis]MDD2092505.1 TetR/AcrR family transcriptional regulator [Pseudomonas guariconensis]